MNRDDLLKNLRESDKFDPTWYRARHPDVELSGIDPAEHYLSIGQLLKRDPGPEFDTDFYFTTYEVQHPNQFPLEDYLTAGHREHRACTRQDLMKRMQNLATLTADVWGKLKDGLEVSYCIPLMNRLDDIKDTLKANLEENARFRGRIEFVLVVFDDTDESEDWINTHCRDALDQGLLRVVRDRETLDSWHFGKAKNAFRPHILGQYYSSLDGDNFVTAAETEKLLDLIAEHPDGFVFHHFSGTFGDGTSGRVTMPTPVYRDVGYDPNLLPRQYDEIDFMLGALTEFPALPLICVDPERNITTMSRNAETYWENERLPNRRLFVAYPERRAPLNPRGEHYAKAQEYLNDMNNLNSALSAIRRAPASVFREEYLNQVQTHKHRFLDTLPTEMTLDTIFEVAGSRVGSEPLNSKDIPLFACVCNEENFLPKFVAHYRSLGVTRFFFVDDHSDKPVSDLDLGDGVFVFRPKVGDFKTAKTLWLESLIRLYVKEGAWLVVADADEFLQLPEPYTDLDTLRADLNARGRDTCPGLLLDMVPGRTRAMSPDPEFDEFLNAFCYREEPVNGDYEGLAPIKWAFGTHSDISWRVDVRYHAFGTVDSLRKFPFFRLAKGLHLNQGFHAFHPTDGPSKPDPEIWFSGPILPIFHYKMMRLFSEGTRQQMLKVTDSYHGRTADNITRIFGDTAGASREALAGQSMWIRPAAEARKRGLFNREKTIPPRVLVGFGASGRSAYLPFNQRDTRRIGAVANHELLASRS